MKKIKTYNVLTMNDSPMHEWGKVFAKQYEDENNENKKKRITNAKKSIL